MKQILPKREVPVPEWCAAPLSPSSPHPSRTVGPSYCMACIIFCVWVYSMTGTPIAPTICDTVCHHHDAFRLTLLVEDGFGSQPRMVGEAAYFGAISRAKPTVESEYCGDGNAVYSSHQQVLPTDHFFRCFEQHDFSASRASPEVPCTDPPRRVDESAIDSPCSPHRSRIVDRSASVGQQHQPSA